LHGPIEGFDCADLKDVMALLDELADDVLAMSGPMGGG
jgi:hypothetical protein